MIKHVVMWKLKDTAAGASKLENAKKLKAKLEHLKKTISQVRSLEVGLNFSQDNAAYDVVLITEFANKKDLEIYINHPDHQALKDFVTQIRDLRVIVDYEL